MLNLVKFSNCCFTFAGSPWGDNSFRLVLVYDSSTKVGEYMILPRIEYGGGVKALKPAGSNKHKYALIQRVIQDLSLEEFLTLILESIETSSSRMYKDGCVLDFRGHIIRSDYLKDEDKFIFSTDADPVLTATMIEGDIKYGCTVALFDKQGNVVAREDCELLKR